MKVLTCWPPQAPSYFNAGHHLPPFQIAAHLRRHRGDDVVAIDAGALNASWKRFADTLLQGRFDAVVIVNDFDVVDGVGRAAEYTRALLPDAAILTTGRLSKQVPGFFERLPIAAIAASGDNEAAAADFLDWVEQGRPADASVPGLHLRQADGWRAPAVPGRLLPSEDWALPDVTEIPYEAYDALYGKDQDKFCGVPGQRELVVPAARGCPVGCSFCDVPAMQGLRDRRLPVARVVDYIESAFRVRDFDYVAFYAPTFTLNRRWMAELCEALQATDRTYPWKCATTIHHLSDEMIAAMGAAGCVRISVGVETLEDEGGAGLPILKRRTDAKLEAVAAACTAAGVELNCFVIVGLPGTTPAGTRRTIDFVRSLGARVRPTLYTDYGRMHETMSEAELSRFNRQILLQPSDAEVAGATPQELYELLFGLDTYQTPAPARIAALATPNA